MRNKVFYFRCLVPISLSRQSTRHCPLKAENQPITLHHSNAPQIWIIFFPSTPFLLVSDINICKRSVSCWYQDSFFQNFLMKHAVKESCYAFLFCFLSNFGILYPIWRINSSPSDIIIPFLFSKFSEYLQKEDAIRRSLLVDYPLLFSKGFGFKGISNVLYLRDWMYHRGYVTQSTFRNLITFTSLWTFHSFQWFRVCSIEEDFRPLSVAIIRTWLDPCVADWFRIHLRIMTPLSMYITHNFQMQIAN